MAITWTYETAFHLLLRGGFGHDGKVARGTDESKLVRKLADMPQVEAVDYLLAVRPSDRQGPGKIDDSLGSAYWDKLQKWWFDRLMRARKPVYEKMVLFLHTHFATAKSTVTESEYMSVQNALFREFAFGDFKALVKRVNVDPAMLWWLNGNQNTASAPNENYGRELQELFTLGVFDFNGARNYSQVDVVEAAKILTGWRFREPGNRYIESYFTFGRHHQGAKNVYVADPTDTPGQNPANVHNEPANSMDSALAQTEHERLVEAIFDHIDTEGRPTTARFIARRMWKFFAYEPEVEAGTARQDLSLIDALADAFKGPDGLGQEYNLKTLLRAMFLRDEFYADTTRTVKGPVEFVIGATRMLGAKIKRDRKDTLVPDSGSDLAEMGQELLNPPDVFSWRGNLFWVTTQTLTKRYEFADELAFGGKRDDVGYDVTKLLHISATIPDPFNASRAAVVDRLLKLLLADPSVVDAASRDQLIGALGAVDPIDLADLDVQNDVRGLIGLILTIPHFHVH
jgi:uncharacterized protein (DUF1800 family)